MPSPAPLHFSVPVAIVALCSAILGGCSRSPAPQPAAPSPTPARAVSPTVLRPGRSTDAQQHRAITWEQLARLFSGKFDELEAEAARLQTSPERLRDGTWQRQAFYDALSCSGSSRDPDWTRFEQALLDWQARYPNSDAVRLALANFYIEYAWKARGSGYANTVTEEGWRLFASRLQTAHRELVSIHSPDYRNESYWQSMLTLARGLQVPKEEVLAEVEKALATSPHRTTILRNTVIYLLPRWFGERGEWQAWLARQTQGAEKSPERDAEYALAVSTALYYVGQDDGAPFGSGDADWPRVRKGLLLREKQFPESLRFKSNLLLMAYYANDRATAREVESRSEGFYEPGALTGREIEDINEWLNEPAASQ